MSEPTLTTVPRDLYYHEVAYVRSLETEIERLRAALEECGKPFSIANSNILISWEMLAREFNNRQAIALTALSPAE
jgi:Ni,Fe-hydrogenase III large subunit